VCKERKKDTSLLTVREIAQRFPDRLAAQLALVQEGKHLCDQDLATQLGCSVESLVHLAMSPRIDTKLAPQ